MAFGLAKSDKQPKDEEEILEGSEDSPNSDDELAEGATAVADPPATEDQPKDATQQRSPVFRPAFLDEETPGKSATAEAEAPPPPEGDAFFVSITKDGAVETHRFDAPTSAQSFVEQLLEEGAGEEDVTAFIGRKLELRVRHRPVVKLFSREED